MYKVPIYVYEIGGAFEIRCPTKKALVHCLNKIPSSTYDKKGLCWMVDGKDALYVKEFCEYVQKRLSYEMIVLKDGGTPEEMYNFMPDLTSEIHAKIQPYDYQRKGIQYMIEHKRCFNCDDMGTGKTAQSVLAIATAKAYPCLVVCPASMKITWQREFKRFAGKKAVILNDQNKDTWHNEFVTGTCNIFITNYESLKKYFVLSSPRTKKSEIVVDPRVCVFKSVIIDECHRCQESQTNWSKYLEKICSGKEYVFMLTGTPIVTSNKNMIEQLRIMGRLDDFGGERVFRNRYCSKETSPLLLSELNYRLWETCYFRREKSLVLKELPPKTRQYHVVQITNKDEYQEAEKSIIDYLKEKENADDERLAKARRGQAIVRINVLRRIAAEGKISEAQKIISDFVESKKKLIIFAAHKQVVKKIKDKFRGVVTVTGDDTPQQKQEAIDKFQNEEDCLLIAINIKSGGVGITLTAASDVLFIEFPWTAADCDQCECRAHRNGQKESVNCIYLLGKDTFDEKMYSIIQNERENAKYVTGAKDDAVEKMVGAFKKIYS